MHGNFYGAIFKFPVFYLLSDFSADNNSGRYVAVRAMILLVVLGVHYTKQFSSAKYAFSFLKLVPLVPNDDRSTAKSVKLPRATGTTFSCCQCSLRPPPEGSKNPAQNYNILKCFMVV